MCLAKILNSFEKQVLAWYPSVQYCHLCKDHQTYRYMSEHAHFHLKYWAATGQSEEGKRVKKEGRCHWMKRKLKRSLLLLVTTFLLILKVTCAHYGKFEILHKKNIQRK